VCDTVAEAVRSADWVLTCVGADKDLCEVYLGPDGIIANAPLGAILVDHTTASSGVAEQLSQAASERGQNFWMLPSREDNKAPKTAN